jgi:hypothetical protein
MPKPCVLPLFTYVLLITVQNVSLVVVDSEGGRSYPLNVYAAYRADVCAYGGGGACAGPESSGAGEVTPHHSSGRASTSKRQMSWRPEWVLWRFLAPDLLPLPDAGTLVTGCNPCDGRVVVPLAFSFTKQLNSGTDWEPCSTNRASTGVRTNPLTL